MKINKWIIISIAVLVIAGMILFLQVRKQNEIYKINSYEGCVAYGLPVADSYPPQCRVPNGKSFTQNIGNELKFHDEILISTPRPNAKVVSPLRISGQARGRWYFEGSFSGELFDLNNKSLGKVVLTAKGEWMTENFVPFEGEMKFEMPETSTGILVIKNANPSGDSKNEKKIEIPVKF